MKVWVVQNESIIDNQEIIHMILILSYIFPSRYERQTKYDILTLGSSSDIFW